MNSAENEAAADTGLTIISGREMTRIQVLCEHQHGLIYVVPAERTWVCTKERLPAHALAGFFRELAALQEPKIQQLMQQWGIYYRQLPLSVEQAEAAAPDS